MQPISFMTANYVARPLGYHLTEGWMQGDTATQAYFQPVATFPERFEAYLKDIAAMGFRAIDLWTAILNPGWATETHLDATADLLAAYDLQPVSLAGWYGGTPDEFDASCALAADLGIEILGGSTSLLLEDRATLVDTLRKYGLRLGLENHPEKTPDELLAKLGAGDEDVIGITVDTGWFGTQGYDGAQALEQLGERVFHVHLKDVLQAGGHETCRFGQGVVPIQACVASLQRVGYQGALSIEHEPEHTDPTDDVVASYALLQGWLA